MYLLSRPMKSGQKGFWAEPNPVVRVESIEKGERGIFYDEITIAPHSVTHVEAGRHITDAGRTLDSYLRAGGISPFVGSAVVVRLYLNNWEEVPIGRKGKVIHHSEIPLEALQAGIEAAVGTIHVPDRLLVTLNGLLQADNDGNEPSNYRFSLSPQTAQWLANGGILAFGTTDLSVDFLPKSGGLPVHMALFEAGAVAYELLSYKELSKVPPGRYFFNGMPLDLAAESSPTTPYLLATDEPINLI